MIIEAEGQEGALAKQKEDMALGMIIMGLKL